MPLPPVAVSRAGHDLPDLYPVNRRIPYGLQEYPQPDLLDRGADRQGHAAGLGTARLRQVPDGRSVCQGMGRQCYALIGSLREPADVGGYPYPVQGEQPYMAVMPPKWAQDCQHGQWVLFLDELTTCPPAVQAALLGVIAENRVGDATLPDTVWKLAACNPPDCAANGSELEPPLANRLCHLTWETDTEAWQRGMSNALGFPQPSFVPLPPDWEKHIGRNTALVGAFHKHKPGLLEAYPKDRAKTSGAWPTMRSWTNAAICAAALEAIDAEPLLRYRAIAGCVGEEAALEFQTWEQSLDLPDPEDWLAIAGATAAGADRPLGPH